MLGSFVRELLHFARFKVLLSGFLFILLGLAQGVGLVLIIPLLSILGLNSSTTPSSSVQIMIGHIMETLGLPLQLTTLLLVYVCIVGLFALLERYLTVLNAEIQQGFSHFWRNRLYGSLTYADWLFLMGQRSADITHALTSDIQQIGSGTLLLFQFSSACVLVLFQIVVALFLSLPLTLLTLLFGAGMVFFIKPLNRQALDTGTGTRFSRQQLYFAVMEHLAGMKTAKSYGVEALHLKRVERIGLEMERRQLQFTRTRANTRFYYELGGVVFLGGFVWAAVQWFRVPLAHLLLLVFIFIRIMPKFSSIQQQYQNIKNLLPAFSGVRVLYQQALAAREPGRLGSQEKIRFQQEIRFEQVSFRYAPQNPVYALVDASFTLPARRITAIAGPSGAGKSTLADLLMGLLIPEKGRILVDGQDILDAGLFGWRHTIGYVPQEVFLFHDTLRANMLWASPQASEAEIWAAFQQAAAADFVRQMPLGLDTVVGERGLRLSGGERQRIALARALLRKPGLLLLDEATSALDAQNEFYIQETLQKLKDTLTIVIIAHRPTTLNQADFIISLENGRVLKTEYRKPELQI